MTRIQEECRGDHTEGRVLSKITDINLAGQGGQIFFLFLEKN